MRRNEPLLVYETHVADEWIDDNGHMNDAAYALVFSRAVDALMDRIGLDATQRRVSRRTLFTTQMMLRYVAEARRGEALAVRCRLLEHDDKRLRLWLSLSGPGGAEFATCEQALLSIDRGESAPHAAEWRAETRAALDALARAHSRLEAPPLAGHGVTMRRA
jgi:acyl-CoA thioester hydrolase